MTSESLGDLANFDPFDPAQHGTHHAVMAERRERCPVARVDSGMVVVSRFDDVRAALSERTMLNSHAARAPGVVVPPEDRLFFFEYDPPEHVPLRRLLLDLLSRQRAEREVPFIRALVEELLGGLLGTGGGEVVSQFSVPLSGRMMMRVAGFPADDALQWRRWINDMAVSGFSFTNRNDRGVGYEACYPELLAYVDDHLAARAADVDAPDDLLTRVAHAAIDGEPLSRTHQRMIMVSVVAGGSNTLVNFVSNTLLALAGDPALVEALRADRDLVTAAVEESLRRDAPSMYITRLCGAP
ncbi:MAG: cytochrome P450, partial [Acidimicrobiia bacterium]